MRKVPKNLVCVTKRSIYLNHIFRDTSNLSPIARYLPMVQTNHSLSSEERIRLWEAVSNYVRRCERQHFKLIHQRNSDYHEERVMMFYELAKVRWEYSPNWVCTAYRTGFSALEALLQFRRMGVYLGKDILVYKTWVCEHYVMYCRIQRLGITFEQHYHDKHGTIPSARTTKLYEQRTEHLRFLLHESCWFEGKIW